MLLIQQNLAGGSNATANANILALTPLRALINAPDVNNGRRSKHLKLRYIIDVTTKPSTTALVRASVGRILPSVTTKVNLSVSTVAYPIGVTTTAKSGSLKNTGHALANFKSNVASFQTGKVALEANGNVTVVGVISFTEIVNVKLSAGANALFKPLNEVWTEIERPYAKGITNPSDEELMVLSYLLTR